MSVSTLLPSASRLDTLIGELWQTAGEADRTGVFPRAHLARLFQNGLLSLTVPRAFGGAGAGLVRSSDVMISVAQGDPAVALILAMQTIHHAALARNRTWPETVYETVARTAARDGALINALRVEPELGSPARGGLPATTARRTEEGWRLSGQKIYSTGAPVLTWMHVWAKTDEATPRVGQFLVAADAPGVRIERTWDQLGMRATESHDVFFDDVLVPAEHAVDIRLPSEWAEPDAVQQTWSAVLVSSVYHGVALAARDWTAQWLHDRVPANLGASLATVPRLQAEFGGIDALLRSNARLLHSAAQAADEGDAPDAVEAGIIKQRVTADAIEAVQRTVAMASNHGLSRRHPLERHLRDVLCGRVHTPQDDSVFLAAGKAALEPFAAPKAVSVSV